MGKNQFSDKREWLFDFFYFVCLLIIIVDHYILRFYIVTIGLPRIDLEKLMNSDEMR